MKIILVQKKSKKTGNLYYAWKVEFEFQGQLMVKYYPFIENDLYLNQLFAKNCVKEYE